MKNRVFYRPTLYDLSQGSRIRFIRYFRGLTQDNISDDLGIIGENKRRTLKGMKEIKGNLVNPD